MNNVSCVKILRFPYGHRLENHNGACKWCHGHNAKVEIHCRRLGDDPTDSIGRVIDFSIIKDRVGTWIDQNLDHGMILDKNDPISKLWTGEDKISYGTTLQGHKFYLLPYPPTAENLARFLLEKANTLLNLYDVDVYKIVFWESETSFGVADKVYA